MLKRFFFDTPQVLEKNVSPYRLNPPVAIIIGHNSRKQGAVNYLGETEFSFNTKVAKELQLNLSYYGVGSIIIQRPSRGGYHHEVNYVANTIYKYNCDYSIELHFNSASVNAKGAEILFTDGKNRGLQADVILQRMLDHLRMRYNINLTSRGSKLVQYGHSGELMIKKIEEVGCKAFLIEPCFGNWQHSEAEGIFYNLEKYAEALCEGIVEVIP